jgi:ribosomal protein L12E/L44/L45/RPP1/RPP2
MAVAASAPGASAPVEEKKEEVKAEAAAEGLSALFG